MVSNRITLLLLAVACVGAAAVGGYVATRQNLTTIPASAAAGLAGAPNTVASAAPANSAAPSTPDAAASVQNVPASPAVQPAVPAASAKSAASTTRAASSAPVRAASTRPAALAANGSPRQEVEPASGHDEPATAADHNLAAGTPSGQAQAAPNTDPQASQRPDDRSADAQRAPDAPVKNFEELVVAADSVVGLQTETAVSTERSRVEDRVEARVVRDVRVGSTIAIPAGSKAIGSVVVVERGGRLKDRARLGIRFESLLLPDGTRLPITTETIYRLSNAPGNVAASRIGGGAVVGAIIGGIVGGGKGAAIGATAGAGAGTASVMSNDRGEASIPAGAEVTARILSPITVTIEKD